jgi:hypothetical protein
MTTNKEICGMSEKPLGRVSVSSFILAGCKIASNTDPDRLALQGIGVVDTSSIWELSLRFQP